MRVERNLLAIHSAVFLFGIAGLFGKLVQQPATVIVAGRTICAALILFLVAAKQARSLRPDNRRDQVFLALTGALLALHWFTFFQSIQVSTVAVGLLTYASFPLFVTFMEPIFFREKIRGLDILFALLVTAGLILVVPDFDLGNRTTQGAAWGVLSGFTFALLSLMNRKYVTRYAPQNVAFHQNLFAALVLLPFLDFPGGLPSPRDLALLVFLGVFCTALAHALFIQGLKTIKAGLAGVIASLEPVYGIIFAVLLLDEIPDTRTLAGGLIILVTTLSATRYRKRDVKTDVN
ncbi:MAG: DMT family transporter [Acidobacteriota bacterium]|nr:DMT family transporter [Acidobacteriota bacterium]